MKQKIMLGLLILAVVGVLTIAKNYDLGNSEEKQGFIQTLIGWTKQISGNIVSITSYSMEQQWTQKNTNTTEKDDKR